MAGRRKGGAPSPDATAAPGGAATSARRDWRQGARLVALTALFLSLAVAMGWIAKIGLVDTLAALRAGQRLVTFDPHDAKTPFLMVAMLAFLAMLGVGLTAGPVDPSAPRRHRKALPDPRGDAVAALLWVVVACLVLFPFGPLVADRVFERAATRAGYQLCPPLEWEHHPQQRWRHMVPGQPPPRCPRTWQEADRMPNG